MSSEPASYKYKIRNHIRNNAVLLTTCLIVISLIFATSFTSTPIFPYGSKSQDSKLALFIFLILLLSTSQFLFLRAIKSTVLNGGKAMKQFHIRILHKVVTYSQYALVGILVITLIQIVTNSAYNISLLIAAIFITHVLAISIMIELAIHFLSWFRFNHNKAVLALTISIIIISVNLGFMLAYYTDSIRNMPMQFLHPVVHPAYFNLDILQAISCRSFSRGVLQYFYCIIILINLEESNSGSYYAYL
jgi:hypothetical protein